MEHSAPTLVIREGLRSLVIALFAVLVGVATLALSLSGGEVFLLGAAVGLTFVLLGIYLLLIYFGASLIASPSGIEVKLPYRSRRINELAWSDVASIEVHPSGRFVTFLGKNGARVNVGPSVMHWAEFVALAVSVLPPQTSAPLLGFERKQRPGLA